MIDGKIELSSGQAAVFAQQDIQFVNQQADFGIALTKQRRVIQFGDDRAGQAAENAFGRGGERIDFFGGEIILDIAQKAVGDEVQTGEAAEQKQNGKNVVIAGGRFEPTGSSGCFKTDNQNCGEIEKQDDRSEKEKVAKFKQSVGERLKMSEKTERGNHFNECLRSKSAEKGQNIFYPAQEKQQVGNDGQYQGNDLIFGEGGHGLRDGKHAAGQQKAAEITAEDNAVIRIAEPIDCQPERKSEQQSQTAKKPGCQKFSPDISGGRHRQRHNLDNGLLSEFFCPKPHGNTGNENEVNPGLKSEH